MADYLGNTGERPLVCSLCPAPFMPPPRWHFSEHCLCHIDGKAIDKLIVLPAQEMDGALEQSRGGVILASKSGKSCTLMEAVLCE